MTDSEQPLSLYVHLPWCVHKCPYCDFNSHTAPQNLPESLYIDALLDDLRQQCERWQIQRPIASIFFGGGTPSLFSGAAIGQILEGIAKLCRLSDDCEVTLEANPGTLDEGHFKTYAAVGVNRLSLGVQSFNEQHLKALGRIHNGKQAHQAIECALKHFARINIDLMFGLPNQTHEQGLQDVETALSYPIEHLSYYQLTLEPNTPFYRRPPALPDETVIDDLHQAAMALMVDSGFQRYEISAFCRGQKYCKHNMNYWQFGDYIGIGCGAHGKISHNNQPYRTRHPAAPMRYVELIKKQSSLLVQPIAQADILFEILLNALRLTDGFDPKIMLLHGLKLSDYAALFAQAESKGLLEISPQRIKASALGLRFLNDLQASFLPEK